VLLQASVHAVATCVPTHVSLLATHVATHVATPDTVNPNFSAPRPPSGVHGKWQVCGLIAVKCVCGLIVVVVGPSVCGLIVVRLPTGFGGVQWPYSGSRSWPLYQLTVAPGVGHCTNSWSHCTPLYQLLEPLYEELVTVPME
jgi:hypothetical protein